MSVRIKDHNNFNKVMSKLREKSVAIGVFGDTGEDIFEKAINNEFGAPDNNIPQRSFIRSTFDDNKKKSEKIILTQFRQALKGNLSTVDILDYIGNWFSGKISEKIKKIETPKNADITIEQKGFNDPLIHSGDLMRKITHRIFDR